MSKGSRPRNIGKNFKINHDKIQWSEEIEGFQKTKKGKLRKVYK